MGFIDSVKRSFHRYVSPIVRSIFLLTTLSILCGIAENSSLFVKISKNQDPGIFLLCIGVCTLFSLPTWRSIREPPNSNIIDSSLNLIILPREQTEEWKGWMQMIILLYHYFGQSQNLPVYQVVRVLVAAYVFLTGYNHTTYFLKTNDFSFERVIKTLLRLNLLSSLLSYVLDLPWAFYYFPGITSFWYLVMLITFRSARTPCGNFILSRVLIMLLISFLLVQASLYTETGEASWTWVLFVIGAIRGPKVDAKEFIFRLKLDSVVPYWGSILAVLVNRMQDDSFNDNSDTSQASPVLRRCVIIHAPWIASTFMVTYFLAIQQFNDKVTSNFWHPFISIIPIFGMLVLRNTSPRQRCGFNRVFQWLGSISLETYVLQSHIWMSNKNKSLLHIGLFDRIPSNAPAIFSGLAFCLDKLVITGLFLLISHLAAKYTRAIIESLKDAPYEKAFFIVITLYIYNLRWDRFVP